MSWAERRILQLQKRTTFSAEKTEQYSKNQGAGLHWKKSEPRGRMYSSFTDKQYNRITKFVLIFYFPLYLWTIHWKEKPVRRWKMLCTLFGRMRKSCAPEPTDGKERSLHRVQGSVKRLWPGLVNFVPAVAYHFCRSMSTVFTQPDQSLSAAKSCREGRRGVGGWVGGCPFKAENNRNSSILLMPSLSGVTRSAWWEGYVYEFHENLDKEGVVQQDALIIL